MRFLVYRGQRYSVKVVRGMGGAEVGLSRELRLVVVEDQGSWENTKKIVLEMLKNKK